MSDQRKRRRKRRKPQRRRSKATSRREGMTDSTSTNVSCGHGSVLIRDGMDRWNGMEWGYTEMKTSVIQGEMKKN